MRELLTPDREANAIRLERATFEGVFLLVEGELDRKFYARFINKATCKIKPVPGKPSSKTRVITIVEILENSNFQGILGIVDADFDHVTNLMLQVANLIQTDLHDLETMLVHSPALEKVVNELGSEEKINNFQEYESLRAALLNSGLPLGYLRWISIDQGLNLSFETISFSKFIDEKKLTLDEIKMIEEVRNKSQCYSRSIKDIKNFLDTKKSSDHDPWQVCCGHDLAEILSLGLRKALGSVSIQTDDLERQLRLAYEEVFFYRIQMYLKIREWENNNSRFQILNHPSSNLQSSNT